MNDIENSAITHFDELQNALRLARELRELSRGSTLSTL
jgi:hypothetical protein